MAVLANVVNRASDPATQKQNDMTTQHTPGPWQIGFGGMDGDTFATITSKFAEYPICQVEPRGYNQANARLIAAAPDLLAAVQSAHIALVHPGSDTWRKTALADIEHALAKIN